MKTATLTRTRATDAGTEGVLTVDDFSCYTLELPWRDNARGKSCIPAGRYPCRIVRSPRFGRVYGVFGTSPRANILIHSGNFAGDVDKGLRSHVQGCILLGRHMGYIDGQRAVLVSRPVVREFIAHMEGEPFELIVEDNNNADNNP